MKRGRLLSAALAEEMRCNRVGWFMVEYLGARLAERINANVVVLTKRDNRERFFAELLGNGVILQEMKRDEILAVWQKEGLLSDIEEKARTLSEVASRVTGAFQAGVAGFRKKLKRVHLLFIADPLQELYYRLGEYEFKQHKHEMPWSIVPDRVLYFEFGQFLHRDGKEPTLELLRIMQNRIRDCRDRWRKMEAAYRERSEEMESIQRIGDALLDVLTLPFGKRLSELEKISRNFMKLGMAGQAWQRDWKWTASYIQRFMKFMGWNRKDFQEKLDINRDTVRATLDGDLPLPPEAEAKLDQLAREVGWTPY